LLVWHINEAENTPQKHIKNTEKNKSAPLLLHENSKFVKIGSPEKFCPRHFFMKKNFASDKTPKKLWVNVISSLQRLLSSFQSLRGTGKLWRGRRARAQS
jgi:hypothetical protein